MGNFFVKRDFLEPRLWYFNDGKTKFKKKARLVADKSSFKLSLDTEESRVDQFEKKFNTITTTSGSSRITLFGCVGYKDMYFSLLREVPMRLVPSYVIHQVMGNSPIPFETNNLKASILGIDHFFDRNLLKYDRDKREFLEKTNYIHEVDIIKGFSLSLHTELDVEDYRDGNFTAKHTSYAELQFEKPTTYSIAIDYFKALEEFFNFVFLETSDEFEFYSTRKKRGKYNYLCQINNNSLKNRTQIENRNAYNILFTIHDLPDPSATIQNWIFSYPKSIEKIWNAIKYLKTHSISENDRFLTLVRAVEGIHRLADSSDNTELISKHQSRVQNIVDQITDEEDKSFVKQALEFRYEPSMRKRLTEISNLAGSLGIPKLEASTINKIINTRNKFVHNLQSDSTKKYLSYSEMYDCNNILAMQIKVIIMLILKIPSENIKGIVAKSNQFKSYYRDGVASSFFEGL